MSSSKRQPNENLIKRLKMGIATAKGIDGDFVYVTVGDAKRILQALEEKNEENIDILRDDGAVVATLRMPANRGKRSGDKES